MLCDCRFGQYIPIKCIDNYWGAAKKYTEKKQKLEHAAAHACRSQQKTF